MTPPRRACARVAALLLALAAAAGAARARAGDPAAAASPAATGVEPGAPPSDSAPSRAPAGGTPRDACVTTAAELVSRVDSRSAASGDPFVFVTVDPTAARGSVPAVPAGTRGYGIVAFADHAHGGGQPGRVLLEPRYLQLPGRHLAATADPIAGDASVAGSTRDAPGALAYLPAFGVVITGYNVVHRGREIAIEPGTTFRIVLGDDVASGKCALD